MIQAKVEMIAKLLYGVIKNCHVQFMGSSSRLHSNESYRYKINWRCGCCHDQESEFVYNHSTRGIESIEKISGSYLMLTISISSCLDSIDCLILIIVKLFMFEAQVILRMGWRNALTIISVINKSVLLDKYKYIDGFLDSNQCTNDDYSRMHTS